MQQRTDVIVVGGGLAGMIAAAEAARDGATVELYEGAGELGGRARTREVQGFAFNQGGHALYLEGALRHTLDRLQIGYTGGSPSYNRALAIRGARVNLLPFTRATIARTGLLGDSERHALVAILRAFAGGTAAPHSGESVSQHLDRLGPPPKVRRVLEALIRLSTYCHAPDSLDATAVAQQVALGFKGRPLPRRRLGHACSGSRKAPDLAGRLGADGPGGGTDRAR
jgi:phytoene dehydrogenase-like protein